MLNIQNKIKFKDLQSAINWPRLYTLLVVFISIALCISGLATIIILSDFSPLNSNLNSVIALLNLDLVLAVMLGAVLVRKIIHTWFKKQLSVAGSQLQREIRPKLLQQT